MNERKDRKGRSQLRKRRGEKKIKERMEGKQEAKIRVSD